MRARRRRPAPSFTAHVLGGGGALGGEARRAPLANTPSPAPVAYTAYAEVPAYVLLARHFEALPGWRYMWHIEGDAVCNGNYRHCLDGTHELPHDLLCSNRPLHSPLDGAGWHWLAVHGELAQQAPIPQRIGCYVMIKRWSREALQLLNNAFPRSFGWVAAPATRCCGGAREGARSACSSWKCNRRHRRALRVADAEACSPPP